MADSERDTIIDEDIVARFRRVQTGVVCDALGRLGLPGTMHEIRPFARSAKLAGPARTLRFAPRRGNALPALNIYEVIRGLQTGDVLVLGTDNTEGWIFGENMAHAAAYQGLAGMVTDSFLRDSAELAELSMPCFARGATTRPPPPLDIVAADVPITCAGAYVQPGDLVVGDADGIIVVPRSGLQEVLLQVEDIDELERDQERAIRDRVPLPELMAVLARKKRVK